MKKNRLIFLIVCTIQLLSCESIKSGLGMQKSAPDEFLVQKRQSIVLPPDYNLPLPDSKIEEKKVTDDQNLNSIFSKELNKDKKLGSETNSNSNSSSSEIENKVLNNIK